VAAWLALPRSLSVGVRRMAAGWEEPARGVLDTPACRGGANASPEAKGAGLPAVALMVEVVVAVMARSLLLAAGTLHSGGGRRWA